uniref:MATE family efflux transporter n=1 Tax=Alistipes sp. TaxID=1872444 RepID=UPI004056AE01
MYSFSRYKGQYSATLKLAVPVVLSQIGQILVQFADNVMVGRYGGDDALPLAAVSFGNSVFFLVFIAAIALSFGLTPLIGELYAQGRIKRSAELFQSGITLYLTIGLLSTLILYGLIPLLYHMGQPTEVVDMAIPYYRYLMWSMPLTMLFFSSKQFLEGLGNTRAQMAVTILCNLLNILLNWIFIYGHWGAPEMGAEGAGLATFLARVLMPILMFGYMIQRQRYRLYFTHFKLLRRRWEDIRLLLQIGFPISMQVLLESAAFVITGIMMGWFSTVAISANQITTIMANTAFSIVMSIGAAVTIRVAHNFGRRDLEEIRSTAKSSYHLVLVWNTIAALLFILLRYPIAHLFTENQEVIELTARMMPFIALFQLSDGIQNVSVGVLRGLQDVKVIMPIAFLAYIVLNLPVGYLLGFSLDMGPCGLILGYSVGLTTAGVLMILRIRRRIRSLAQLGA